METVILDFNTKGTNMTKPRILTPKRYDNHPSHFYMGVPPPPGANPSIYITEACSNNAREIATIKLSSGWSCKEKSAKSS